MKFNSKLFLNFVTLGNMSFILKNKPNLHKLTFVKNVT